MNVGIIFVGVWCCLSVVTSFGFHLWRTAVRAISANRAAASRLSVSPRRRSRLATRSPSTRRFEHRGPSPTPVRPKRTVG